MSNAPRPFTVGALLADMARRRAPIDPPAAVDDFGPDGPFSDCPRPHIPDWERRLLGFPLNPTRNGE